MDFQNALCRVTIGLLDHSPVHPREVYADVIADRAAAVIFAHNHPSGDVQPSDADLRTHEQLTEAGKILGLRVVDHVIVARKGYLSSQEAGLMGRSLRAVLDTGGLYRDR
jgi:DNA repair protein RadC